MRSVIGDAPAGTRAYGAGCISSMRSLSSRATSDAGATAATATNTTTATDSTANGMAHQRCQRGGITPGAPTASSPAGTVVLVVSWVIALSVEVLTTRAAVIAALAVLAAVLAGWSKPARATTRWHRGLREPRRGGGVPVEQQPAPAHRTPGPLRRVIAVGALGGISVLTGTIIAIILGYAAVWAVVELTDLLTQ